VVFVSLLGPRLAADTEPPIDLVVIGLLNALVFALPQLVWLGATALFHLSSRVCDSGLVAADLILVVFAILVVIQTDTLACSFLWLLYVPVAIIASVLTGIVARVSAVKV
jgi:uncharacterized membrane protein YwaF